MLGFIGNLVGGGIDAIGNITDTIGKGASTFFSGFFPTAQKTTVKSDFTLERENQGLTFRPVTTDAKSIYGGWGVDPIAGTQATSTSNASSSASGQSWLSNFWSGFKTGFSTTPLGLVTTGAKSLFASPSKTTQQLTSTLAQPQLSGFDKMLQDVYTATDNFATGSEKVLTLADRLYNLGVRSGILQPRETTYEQPTAGYPEGQNLQHLNNLTSMGAEVLSGIAATADSMWSQLKGLFNLAYQGSDGAQPVFTVQHEIEPSSKTTTGIIIAAVVLFVLYLIFRKRK